MFDRLLRLLRLLSEVCAGLAGPGPPNPSPVGDDLDPEDGRDSIGFSPELFEARTDVIAELSDRGIEWLSHYGSVDLMHDGYGIEVCGVHDEDDGPVLRCRNNMTSHTLGLGQRWPTCRSPVRQVEDDADGVARVNRLSTSR